MNTIVIAIDPGPVQSAILTWNGELIGVKEIEKNGNVLHLLSEMSVINHHLVIERVASYGMPVGVDVFETVYWTGRFVQRFKTANPESPATRMPRMDVKMHICQNSRAKDSNIRQALIDRFGPPGSKKAPGLTYGLKKDLWQAFAVAVTYFDTTIGLG